MFWGSLTKQEEISPKTSNASSNYCFVTVYFKFLVNILFSFL